MSSDTPNDASAGAAVPSRSQRRRAGRGTGALTPLRCCQGHGAAAGRGFGSSLADEERNRWDWPKASLSFRPAGEESLGPGDPYSTGKPREVPNVPGQDCRSSRLFGTGRYHGVVDSAPYTPNVLALRSARQVSAAVRCTSSTALQFASIGVMAVSADNRLGEGSLVRTA